MSARRRAGWIAASCILLLPPAAVAPARGAARTLAAATPPDLTVVGYQSRLPDSGHLRFIRASTDGRLLFVGTAAGALERSADGGRTWRDVLTGVPGGPGAQTLDLEISQSDPRVVWAVGLTGVFRSTDAGQTWLEADTRSDAPGRALGSVLALDPRHPEAAYLAGYRNGGLYRTGDGGRSWQQVIPYPVSGVAVEPANGAIIYAISRTAGLQRSIDHGFTWGRGVHLPDYTGVGVETAQPGRLLAVDGPGGGLYAAMDGGGLEWSTDGGQSWQDVSSGLPKSAPGEGYAVPYDLTVIRGAQPRLYAIVPSGVLGAPSGGALYAARLPGTSAAAAGLAQPDQQAGHTGAIAPLASAAFRTASARAEDAGAPAVTDTPVPPVEGTATAPQPTATPTATATAAAPSATATAPSPTARPSATPTATPIPLLTWHLVASNVDAVTALPGAAEPLVGAEAAPSTGLAATVRILNGGTILGVPYRLPAPSARVVGNGFAIGSRPLPYLTGVNYEGPDDRPWQMWQDAKWDPSLIAGDLDAAAAAGYQVLRVFVQDPLPSQVLAGQFGHLDTLVALARQRDLRLLITFNDSHDPDLSRVTAVDHAIAAHLAGNPTVFGYDLQNEPHLQDIAGVTYPPGITLPLLSDGLIRRYGEEISLKQVRSQRAAGEWLDPPYDQMSTEQVYRYLNGAAILDAFLNANPDYPDAPVSARWAPVLDAANASLATYLRLQTDAVRSADPAHLITVGYNSWFWSALPANQALDFRSIHLYPTPRDWSSMHGILRSYEDLRGLARTPLVLEEYGFSTDSQSSSVASVQETAMSLYLRVLGGAGDVKWMLNDDTVGANPYENGLGLIGAGGVPKAGYYVDREVAAYFNGPHQPGGVRMWADDAAGVGYLYAAPDALGVSGGSYQDSRLRYRPRADAASAQLWMDWAHPGILRLISTHEADLQADLARLAGAQADAVVLTPSRPFGMHNGIFHLHMSPGVWYTLTYTPGAAGVPALAPALPRPALAQGWYILQTGHNVLPPFLKLWLQLGGVPVAGAPLAEAQAGPLGPVQYFENVEMRAQGQTVQLLPLGLDALGGQAAPPAPELPKQQRHRYFAATGHNLHGAFLSFWQATGGAQVWGPPISEEEARGGLRVQYFANAEFVWDGTSVTLAPLGARACGSACR